MTRTEYRWLLPSAMAGGREAELVGERPGIDAGPPRARPRRTVRDWIVDTVLFVLAAFVGMAAADVSDQINDSDMVVLVDQLVGAAACCALWLRRRWPVQLALALALTCFLVPVVGGAFLVAVFSLAVHRPFRPVGVIGLLSLASACVSPLIRPDPTADLWASVIGGSVLVLLALGWGMLVRARRQLVVVLQERARRAETEAELRAEQAQRLAREAIAREMHDVLAHRLTLLSVHAGALEFRPDAPPAEVARAAGVIRDSAHEALQDLRQIIGVLRTPGDHESGDRPQPTLASLDALVHESREAGMTVRLDQRIAEPVAVPGVLGRTVYRIVQEALTNARKHAPGAEVTLTLAGAPADGLTVAVDNPAPRSPRPITAPPGSGQGLIGLGERAMLAGGTLEHGRTGDGGFHVRAWLPWAV
ncbi:sensor histidine kinase [Streptomyces sp. NBC_00690]|uniref:sensor histidine kinase n=1 Tax=Streptomyces sp. NBC_00690 TaxID=2975808 RepID=UPI002E2B8A7E|nr:histidine kinase [Streptomyces sp. NBC_00690]